MNHSHSITFSSSRQHLSLTERIEIQKSLKKGFSIRSIAIALNRAPSTISREIKRNSISQRKVIKYKSKLYDDFFHIPVYFADSAHNLATNRLGKRGAKYKINDISILNFISDKIIKDKFSPDVISSILKKSFNISICTKTIYNYIDKSLLNARNIDLLRKVRFHRKSKGKRTSRRHYGTSIEFRPDSINSRLEFGHYEGDLIVGKSHKSALLTLNERISRKLYIFKLPFKTADCVFNTIKKFASTTIVKSITFDNGSEFAKCCKLENIGVNIYYAHPYSSFERGSNENLNGMVRRFLPKGTDFSKVSNDKIISIQNWINNYPRKILNYLSAQEMFNIHLAKLSS